MSRVNMKFSLTRNAPLRLQRREGFSVFLSATISNEDIKPFENCMEETIELCNKLRQSFQSQSQSTSTSQPHSGVLGRRIWTELTLEIVKVKSKSRPNVDRLRVKSGPWTAPLVELCGHDIKLQLAFTDEADGGLQIYDKVESSEMKFEQIGDNICEDNQFCASGDIGNVWNLCSGNNGFRGELTVIVICNGKDVSGPVVTDKMQINRRMLLEEIRSDVVIIPANGIQVKSHTAILAAHSDVFNAMFQSEMKEATTHTVEMPDMREEGVRGLLAYLYCWEEVEPNSNSVVAFEMLHAAHKYNIPVLETAMKKLLLAKPETWYDVDVAMKLFLLSRNLPVDGHRLKMKAIKVMKINFGNFKKSPTYVALFKEDPEAAMDLCEYFVA